MYYTVLAIDSLFVSTNPNSHYIGKFESGALFIALSFVFVQAGWQRKKKQGPKQHSDCLPPGDGNFLLR